jgi:hypothetical protein
MLLSDFTEYTAETCLVTVSNQIKTLRVCVVDQHWGIPYQRRSRKEGSGMTPASEGNHEIEESRSESV